MKEERIRERKHMRESLGSIPLKRETEREERK